jgi:hypothetical protein
MIWRLLLWNEPATDRISTEEAADRGQKIYIVFHMRFTNIPLKHEIAKEIKFDRSLGMNSTLIRV